MTRSTSSQEICLLARASRISDREFRQEMCCPVMPTQAAPSSTPADRWAFATASRMARVVSEMSTTEPRLSP